MAAVIGAAITMVGVTLRSESNGFSNIPKRNMFGLKPPLPAPAVTNQPAPPAKVSLTGITTLLGKKKAFMILHPFSSHAALSNDVALSLGEGESASQVKVTEIDERSGLVKIMNAGTPMTLSFEKDGLKPTGPVAPSNALTTARMERYNNALRTNGPVTLPLPPTSANQKILPTRTGGPATSVYANPQPPVFPSSLPSSLPQSPIISNAMTLPARTTLGTSSQPSSSAPVQPPAPPPY